MKKKLFLILMLSLFLMTGCSKETKFKSVDRTTTGFHKVNVAEKNDDGVLYFKGDKILYDKDGTVMLNTNLFTNNLFKLIKIN